MMIHIVFYFPEWQFVSLSDCGILNSTADCVIVEIVAIFLYSYT